MIYLVGSPQAGGEWLRANGADVSTEALCVNSLEQVQGRRLSSADRVIVLHNANVKVRMYLAHELEMARERRDSSMRQAP